MSRSGKKRAPIMRSSFSKQAQEDYIRQHYGNKKTEDIAEYLGITVGNIYQRVCEMKKENRMSMTFKTFDEMTNSDYQFVSREMKKGTRIADIAKALYTSLDVVMKVNTIVRNDATQGHPKPDVVPKQIWSTERRREFLNDHQSLSPANIASKYNIDMSSISSYISRFKRSLGIESSPDPQHEASPRLLTELPIGSMQSVVDVVDEGSPPDLESELMGEDQCDEETSSEIITHHHEAQPEPASPLAALGSLAANGITIPVKLQVQLELSPELKTLLGLL